MKRILTLICLLLTAVAGYAQVPSSDSAAVTRGALGVVATSHLDTQWRWTIKRTIDNYVPATLHDNFKLFELYPGYVFSFEGAFRYMLAREYYPSDYERLKGYIRDGRWRVTGSWVDAADVNVPAFESLVRHALYGNGYFKREFGKTSRDVFMPDCFGFGYALPSIAAHCGLKSFSTQKLSWGCSVPVPFDIGLWEGVDGSTLVAGIRPGDYVSTIKSDLSRDSTWMARVRDQGDSTGLYAAYRYFGTGDEGGAPESVSVAWLEESLHSDGPLSVRSIGADGLVELAGENPTARLKRYKGELLMTRHGVGCYTSEAAMKRWNRKNELLADAAERASVIADLLGVAAYPTTDLRDTWTRFLWHQFHDDVTGTSIPEAYEFSWNDEILCQNRFAAMLTDAVAATTPRLDTRAKGVPLVVFNPLAIEREDPVEATVVFPAPTPSAVRVFGPDGKEVPSQIIGTSGDSLTVVFMAHAPAVGYAVFDVRPATEPSPLTTGLSANDSTLENQRYVVRINAAGEIASIRDKRADRELLAAPIALQMLHDKPKQWPAWEIQYEDLMSDSLRVLGAPAQIRVTEHGPARVAVEITQQYGQSVFRTTLRLAAGGAQDRLECASVMDWRERETLLKAAFTVASPGDSVTYDLGLGTIQRGLNSEKKYEVPGHQWADLTSLSGDYGVAILNDCRYGWDHPNPATLRLTLVHTPGVFDNWSWVGDQSSQDIGRHTLTYAVMGHSGDWRAAGVPWEAARLNQPLRVFQAPAHKGEMGREYSLCHVGGAPRQVFINAIKKAEDGNELVVRVRELHGNPADSVTMSFPWPVTAAREVTGAEEGIRGATIRDGALVFSLTPYQPRAFALSFVPKRKLSDTPLVSQTIPLPYDLDGISTDGDHTDGNIDGKGGTLSGDLLPTELDYLGVTYALGPSAKAQPNLVACNGQTITLPPGGNMLNLLAASVNGPSVGTFLIDGVRHEVPVQDYREPIGQWNNRLQGGRLVTDPDLIAPAYVNRQPVAWYGSHRHIPTGNASYEFTYLFLVSLLLPEKATTLTLPVDPRIVIAAATVVDSRRDNIRPAFTLYDEADAAIVRVIADDYAFIDTARCGLSCPVPGASIHYTLDGGEPTAASPLYASPVALTSTTTLRARAFRPGYDSTHVARVTFTQLALKEPAMIEKTAPGLVCRYYEGTWSRLPSFDTVALVRDTITDTITVPRFAREEHYAVVLDGYLHIPRDGLYTFYISSDDGSTFTVHDSLLVDNDGLHSSDEKSGQIALSAGLHPIRVAMFNGVGGHELVVSWRGPGFDKQSISPAALSYDVRSLKALSAESKSKRR